MSDPIYSGEATLRGRGETDRAGRWIRLEIEDFGGTHPFKGYEGERFAVVIVGPLASDEHEIPSPQDKRGVSAGGGVGRDGETQGSPATPTIHDDGPSSTTIETFRGIKPKRRWQDMPASQRAALMVKDQAFREFVAAKAFCFPAQIGEREADTWLKSQCGIESKATLDIDPGERRFYRDQFSQIEREFEGFRQARGHGVI